jgi:hypothetical protein
LAGVEAKTTMAGGSRKSADDALVAALAGGNTVEAAAALCAVSEATVYRRLREPGFRRRVSWARAELLERALGHLAQGSAEAAIQLRNLVADSKDERVKLGACRTILEMGARLRETVELAEDLAEMQRQLEDLQRGGDESQDPCAGPAPGPGCAEDGEDGRAPARPPAG